MEMEKGPLGLIRPCGAPTCDILTNKRYRAVPSAGRCRKGSVVVACCPKHAEVAYAVRIQREMLVAVA